jgi:uncharacterized protein (TIGR00251 family)
MVKISMRKDGRIGFRVHVQPSAAKNELLGWNSAGELRVRLTARPVEGAANRGLEAFLAKILGIRKRDISIESGERSRLKTISAPASAGPLLEEIPEI